MRIGLLNPWEHAAENQLIPVIAAVAEQFGHVAFECKNTQDILREQPDIVIAMSRTAAKLTDVPTYGLLFDPRDILLQKASYLDNIYSWDGVFTVFSKLQDFTADLMHAARRDTPVGYFYPTCRIIEWDTPIDFQNATLAYFGTNWDRRRQDVFIHLAGEPWMEVYGPPHGWTFLKDSTYKGSLPFDGTSVIQRYHDSGVGLCLFSDSHVADDIVTSRIFEVSAAGAIIMAPRMPWLERHYGGAVLYLDQHVSDREMAEQIRTHMQWIRSHPTEARALAAASHRIFREQFSMERLVPQALDFHAARASVERHPSAPADLTVIVTCADRSATALRRTLASLVRQAYAPLQVIVSAPANTDPAHLAGVINEYRGRVPGLKLQIADAPFASATVWQPLAACSGELVAVVESGDEWLAGHITNALSTSAANPGAGVFVSGCIEQLREPYRAEGGNAEIRRLRPFPFFHQPSDPVREALDLPISSVIFRRDLLDPWMLRDPQVTAGGAAHLLLSLLEKAPAACTYRASILHYVSVTPSTHRPTHNELDDLVRLRTRFVGRRFTAVPRLAGLDALRDAVQRVPKQQWLDQQRIIRHGESVEYLLPPPFAYSVGAETAWDICDVPITLEALQLLGTSHPGAANVDGSVLPLVIEPEPQPWATGLVWTPALADERPHVIQIRCQVEAGTAAIGIRGISGQQMDHRVLVGSQPGQIVVNLPVAWPSSFGGVVVQAAHSGEPVRVVLQDIQVFASNVRLPPAETERFMHTEQRLQDEVDSLRTERDALARELNVSRKRVREIRSSRVWRLGQFYWRIHHRLTGQSSGEGNRDVGTT